MVSIFIKAKIKLVGQNNGNKQIESIKLSKLFLRNWPDNSNQIISIRMGIEYVDIVTNFRMVEGLTNICGLYYKQPKFTIKSPL